MTTLPPPSAPSPAVLRPPSPDSTLTANSAAASTKSLSASDEKPTVVTLESQSPPTGPLTLRQRLHCYYLRLFPQTYYTRFSLPRRTFASIIAGLLLLILLLIIILPATLVSRSSSSKRLSLPIGAELYSGDGTYYGPGLGACGIDSTANDAIVAISHEVFDYFQPAGTTNPNLNPSCGRKIRARRRKRENEGVTWGWKEDWGDDGKGKVTVEVTVVDRCTGCKPGDLDFSISVFEKLGREEEGRIGIEWAWV